MSADLFCITPADSECDVQYILSFRSYDINRPRSFFDHFLTYLSVFEFPLFRPSATVRLHVFNAAGPPIRPTSFFDQFDSSTPRSTLGLTTIRRQCPFIDNYHQVRSRPARLCVPVYRIHESVVPALKQHQNPNFLARPSISQHINRAIGGNTSQQGKDLSPKLENA